MFRLDSPVEYGLGMAKSGGFCRKCGTPRVDATDGCCGEGGAPYAPTPPQAVEPAPIEPNDDLDGQEWVHDVYTKYMETPAQPPEAVEPPTG